MNSDDAHALFAMLLRRVAPEVDLEVADPTAPLQQELDLDSMDFLALVTGLRDETGFEIPERDYGRVGSVDAFVSYLVDAADRGALVTRS